MGLQWGAISHGALRGATQDIRHAQSGNVQCLQNAQLFILASKHHGVPHDQLLPEDKIAVRKFDSINPVPSIFCEDAAFSNRSPRLFQFAYGRRLRRSASVLRKRIDRRTSLTEGSMACAVVDGGSNLLET